MNLSTINNETVIENSLTNVQKELTEVLGLQAKHDAQNKVEMSLTSFKIMVRGFVHSKIQPVIDNIRQLLIPQLQTLPISQLEEKAQVETAKNEAVIKEKEHEKVQLQGKKNAITIDPLKSKYWIPFLFVCILAGWADGGNSFSSLSKYYPFVVALISSIMIGSVVAFGHHFYAGWIQRSKNTIQKYIKIAIVLSIAFGFFYWISVLRVQATQDALAITSALSVGRVNIGLTQFSPFTACCISFVLFATVFFLSLNFWSDKQERLDKEELKRVNKQLEIIQAEIESLQKQNEQIAFTLTEQKNRFNTTEKFLVRSIERAKNIGESAIKLYKHSYARYHGSVPDFFDEEFLISYNDNIEFTNN